MKPKFTDQEREALLRIKQSGDSRRALTALAETILSEKFRKPLFDSGLEQFSELGIRTLAHRRALHDGAFKFFQILLAEITPKPGQDEEEDDE